MKLLENILSGLQILETRGDMDISVSGIQFDSRRVQADELFVAVQGTLTDGHDFLPQALQNGAVAVVCQRMPLDFAPGITYILVEDSSYALGVIAHLFYDRPSEKVKLIGVTGTNGKTTVATLLYQLFRGLGFFCGMISTVQNKIGDRTLSATHTTPDALALNRLLADMVEEGCDYCFMEVSSHAVVQHRIAGLNFSGGVFTNISHDHLDFHKTFDNYIKAKKAFFDQLPRSSFALVNVDDKVGPVMLQNTIAYKKTYGLKKLADYNARIVESHFSGMLLAINKEEVWVKLVGQFNAQNLLAVYSTAMLLEQDNKKVLTVLSRLTGADGRFETLISPDNKVAIVDYAHTPDALENVLRTINQLRRDEAQIITVFGCGGDRDKSKRASMAAVAVALSDKVILTSDNPRSEDPMDILRDMETGIPSQQKRKSFTISDRREAIRAACHLAQSGDIVLVAGKGHETYQEIAGVRYPFDDKEVLIATFKEK